MPIFMKAGSIEGDVVAASHRGWTTIESCSFNVSFEEDDVRKSQSDGAPLPQLSTMEVTQEKPDRSAPALMQWMVDGDTLDKVEIDVCGDTLMDGDWRCNLRYVLKKVVLRDYSFNLGSGEKGEVDITMQLEFDELSIEHFSYNRANAMRTTSKAITHKHAK